MKILITGGSGFIGINLIEKLIQENITVLNTDIVPPPNPNQVQYFRKIDINDFDSLNEVINKYQPDYIIHLAARVDLNGLIIDEYKTNFTGTENLIKAINNTPSVKKIIYTSSMLVCKAGHNPSSSDDFSPNAVYGESKVIMEN